ncbi:unnamed protein product, partial [marine sediment metagenome]
QETNAKLQKADEALDLLVRLSGGNPDITVEPARECVTEGSGCGHIPGDDECNDCENWQVKDKGVEHGHNNTTD